MVALPPSVWYASLFDAAGIVNQAAGVDQHAGYGAQANNRIDDRGDARISATMASRVRVNALNRRTCRHSAARLSPPREA